jgi:hypothetical protein
VFTPYLCRIEDEIPHLELTTPSLAWDCYDEDFATQEESHINFRGHLISVARSDGSCWNTTMGTRSADAVCKEEPHWKLSQVFLQYDTADVTDADKLGVALEATVQVSLVCTCLSPETYDVCGVHMGMHKGVVDHVTLANRWQILLHKSKNTVQCTTQKGVCMALHPTLSRNVLTNDRMLLYSRMPHNLYSDTMLCPKIPSAQGSTMAQIFMTNFGWS